MCASLRENTWQRFAKSACQKKLKKLTTMAFEWKKRQERDKAGNEWDRRWKGKMCGTTVVDHVMWIRCIRGGDLNQSGCLIELKHRKINSNLKTMYESLHLVVSEMEHVQPVAVDLLEIHKRTFNPSCIFTTNHISWSPSACKRLKTVFFTNDKNVSKTKWKPIQVGYYLDNALTQTPNM